jgi:hypothetical protein
MAIRAALQRFAERCKARNKHARQFFRYSKPIESELLNSNEVLASNDVLLQ